MNLLDLDKDGELTVAELKGAIKKILKRSISEEEAQEIVMLIDRNNDGKGDKKLKIFSFAVFFFVLFSFSYAYSAHPLQLQPVHLHVHA